MHAGRLTHRNIQIEANSGGCSFSGPSNDVVFPDIVTRPHTSVAQNAGAMIDQEDGRRSIVFAPAGARPRGRRRIREHLQLEARRIGAASFRHLAELIEMREFLLQLRRMGRLEMIRRQKFCHDFHRLPNSVAIGAGSVHGENFHPVSDLVLARRQQFTLRGAAAPLLPVDLHDAKPADRNRMHVRLMAENRDRNFLFVAYLLHVELSRRVVDCGVTRRGAPLQIDHDIAIGIGQRLGQRHGDRHTVDLKRYVFFVVGFCRRIEPNELAVDVPAE